MKKMDLSFCEVEQIDSSLAKLTIYFGVEVEHCHIEELQSALANMFDGDFVILLDHKHQHSYTYESMAGIGEIDGLRALAFLTYSMNTIEALRIFTRVPRRRHLNLEFFFEADQAMTWLRYELIKSTNRDGKKTYIA